MPHQAQSGAPEYLPLQHHPLAPRRDEALIDERGLVNELRLAIQPVRPVVP